MSVIIRLQNLPMSANASNIRRFFGGLTIPEGGVHIVGGTDGDAFIAFATDEDARKGMLLDRQPINGAAVRLYLSSKAEMQSVIESARISALFTGQPSTPSVQSAVPQKNETMQALDVTAPTLPSSFSSYRNGSAGDFPSDRSDPLTYQYKRPSSPSSSVAFDRPPFDHMNDDYLDSLPPRVPEKIACKAAQRSGRHEYDHPHVSRFEVGRGASIESRFNTPSTRMSPGTDAQSRRSPELYSSHYSDMPVDGRVLDQFPVARSRENMERGDNRDTRIDPRYRRPNEPLRPYDGSRSSVRMHPDRFASTDLPIRESAEVIGDVTGVNNHVYPNDRRSSGSNYYERELPYLHAVQNERDFSIRPPWLNEDLHTPGHKRQFQGEHDEFPRKRRPLPPQARLPNDERSNETEFVVRVTMPLSEVGIKAIFEVLRGVHIVPKWGIRIEEDSLQRATGYIFIMMTARESYERALACDGRIFKGKAVGVASSSSSEFFRVTDSSFRSKCPPEVLRKLPLQDQPVCAPHHSDGCLEVAQLPPDCSKLEIVRFLGAPGLTVDNVCIAGYPSSDRTASSSLSVRALVRLPSPKDIEILLSAKPRPLRSDGLFPAVRLTPISQLQLDAYSSFHVGGSEESEQPKQTETKTPSVPSAEENPAGPLTCAYLSNLECSLQDADVLRFFPSVLIPGDAIHMVSPANTSAYIDFISENNCRRAIADINAVDSKAKLSNPAIRIEAISRGEMENRMGLAQKVTDVVVHDRPPRPSRERDPREYRGQWDGRSRPIRHPSPFRGRSPQSRSKFEDPYYDHNVQLPYEGIRGEPYNGPMRRTRPPMEMPHPNHLPLPGDYLLTRPGEHQSLPGPGRRPPMDFVTVFVGNLPGSVSVEQLSGVMRDYYFVPGSVRVRRDMQGQPTGEALVDFNSSYDADRAIRDLNGYRLAGRPIMLHYDRRP